MFNRLIKAHLFETLTEKIMEEYGTKIAVIQARKHYVPEKNSRKTILIDITRTPN